MYRINSNHQNDCLVRQCAVLWVSHKMNQTGVANLQVSSKIDCTIKPEQCAWSSVTNQWWKAQSNKLLFILRTFYFNSSFSLNWINLEPVDTPSILSKPMFSNCFSYFHSSGHHTPQTWPRCLAKSWVCKLGSNFAYSKSMKALCPLCQIKTHEAARIRWATITSCRWCLTKKMPATKTWDNGSLLQDEANRRLKQSFNDCHLQIQSNPPGLKENTRE